MFLYNTVQPTRYLFQFRIFFKQIERHQEDGF
jgi:hypothetical protein